MTFRIFQRLAHSNDFTQACVLDETWDTVNAANEYKASLEKYDELHEYMVVDQKTVDAAYQEAECHFGENDITDYTDEEFDYVHMKMIETFVTHKTLEQLGEILA
jgi:hypothetical protein